ncbi:transglutaminase-like cysteine peptidase [Mesorhizobium sp. BH1-1-4]|uniref:transglutaminase-like cysteine peptidase n=1 Tax=Mesorhizobium sp. BH1-1-4 TaxID=2876662 RepID=UPI001CD0AD2D|nr:transglutaminase-like cysteine peptidase [Mesorhizobium sp. BH1-1-4]MBZ9995316.1 transglutaminase-like cysteine peptidase [Mesorhizobium sp. BH1-1-4]
MRTDAAPAPRCGGGFGNAARPDFVFRAWLRFVDWRDGAASRSGGSTVDMVQGAIDAIFRRRRRRKHQRPLRWVDFCHRRPKECKVPALPAANVKLTARNLRILKRINQKANSSIKPVSNFDHWGTMADHWDYPVDGKGDCKIYALYKRKLLQEAGFPRQALLMTVVRDLNNEGHTVLTVKTDKGDLVLDNLVDEIRPWNATGYYFLKRQSQQNPNIWLSVNQRGGTPRTSKTVAKLVD